MPRKNYSKTGPAPKRRNIVALHVKMRSGAGLHHVEPTARRAGPDVAEWEDNDGPDLPMFFDLESEAA
jgi:hypothetical protein